MTEPPTADPYLPDHGDPGFHVEHYGLDLSYSPASNHLSGSARLTIRPLHELEELTLDLYRLQVVKLNLRGAKLARWRHRGSRLVLQLGGMVGPEDHLELTVQYRGQPQTMPGPDGRAGWEELTDGVIVASQPHGAPTWFPCNDRADDKASYDITVSTGSDYTVVANGELVSTRRRAGSISWHYRMAEPMAPYLATVQIGAYASQQLPPDARSQVVATLHCPPELQARARAAFDDQTAMIATFERLFGPYPFGGYAVVVTADALEIPLESQSLSTFGSNLCHRGWEAQRLIAHELSHQWFGNAVTARRLSDIWLHEGFACYCEWLWSQESGRESTDAQARRHWNQLQHEPKDLVISAPGANRMFDDRVYKRGATTLHALRLTIGDEAFFTLLRTWVQRFGYRSVSTPEFIALANEISGQDLGELFASWLDRPELPRLP